MLDLGCGNGHLLSLVLAHCPESTGAGLDFSPTMLAQARERIHDRFVQAMGMKSEDEDPSNKLLDVETHLRWLREIGFEDVDCHWKWRELALLSGRKLSGSQNQARISFGRVKQSSMNIQALSDNDH